MAEVITIRVDEKEELVSVIGPISAVAHPIPNVGPAIHQTTSQYSREGKVWI